MKVGRVGEHCVERRVRYLHVGRVGDLSAGRVGELGRARGRGSVLRGVGVEGGGGGVEQLSGHGRW